jgi:hypothetical protein
MFYKRGSKFKTSMFKPFQLRGLLQTVPMSGSHQGSVYLWSAERALGSTTSDTESSSSFFNSVCCHAGLVMILHTMPVLHQNQKWFCLFLRPLCLNTLATLPLRIPSHVACKRRRARLTCCGCRLLSYEERP